MALERKIQLMGMALTPVEEQRIEHRLDGLERRLTRYPSPNAALVLRPQPPKRQVQADLHLNLTPGGAQLISHQAAETADHAVGLAVDDVLRQYERYRSIRTHESTYGVPSRREAQEHSQQARKNPDERDNAMSSTVD